MNDLERELEHLGIGLDGHGEQRRRIEAQQTAHQEEERALRTRISAIQERINAGESTGNPIQDYCITHTPAGTNFYTQVFTSLTRITAELAHISTGIPILHARMWHPPHEWRNSSCQLIIPQNPPYCANARELTLVGRGVNVRCEYSRTLNAHTFTLEEIDHIPFDRLSTHTTHHGWDAIRAELTGANFRELPDLSLLLLTHFERPATDELRETAYQLEDKRVLGALKRINDIYAQCVTAWDTLERYRSKREALQKKREILCRSPVFGIRDQLERDDVQHQLDIMLFESRPDHDQHTRTLMHAIKEAQRLGLHKHPRTLYETHRPGHQTHWHPGTYLSSVASELELL